MESEFDIVVAGGGMAGLSAGLASARLGVHTLVLTGEALGGNLLSIERVEGYPGFPEGVPGYELAPLAQAQAAEAGAEFSATTLDALEPDGSLWRLATGEGEVRARAVILATGSRFKTLGIPGEEQFKGKGVSHCASCDAPLLRNLVVAVAGGGDSALQESLTLAEHASRVIILQRGEELTAQATFRDRVLAHSKIEVRYGCTVEEICGETAVSSVRVRRGAGLENLEVAALFAFVGLAPNTDFLRGALQLDAEGRIPTDACLATALPGVFAAGSIRAGWAGRAAVSAGDGSAAAVAAARYLDRRIA